MSAVPLTRMYDLLVPKLGKEATECFISYNETTIKSELENSIKHLATKEDLAKLSLDISKLETKMSSNIGRLEIKINSDIGRLETKWSSDIGRLETKMSSEIGRLETKMSSDIGRVEGKISESKAEIIKWMFIFWIGQVTAIIIILLKK